MTAPSALPERLAAYGLPGLFDVHVHFLPPNIQAAVWRQFDEAGPKIGRAWPIRYRGTIEERVEQLRGFGVRRFTSLPYAHKPGVAGYLNDWAAEFSTQYPDCLRSATFYPEPGVEDYVAAAIDAGVQVFKIHTQVGEFLLDDPLLDLAWDAIAEAAVPVVTHVGSGPVGNVFTGPEHLRRLLVRQPDVPVVVAHLGAPEFAEFLDLAETYEHTRLDTTMVFTDFLASFPDELLPRVGQLGDKILYGSDFPTIPYDYEHQFDSLARLLGRAPGLDDDWLRKVCWGNAAGLFSDQPV
ncbi:putative TIM-barrel fold metal-dependent hydrolase [Marmoricola sp. OAE513]|uniref:amidohydrolase family protein n=1 Tax=Marmoricola sp. OAE513 TaxID=2817894 RepID=UPI001AEB10B6